MADLNTIRAHALTYGSTPEGCQRCQAGEPSLWVNVDGSEPDQLRHLLDLDNCLDARWMSARLISTPGPNAISEK